MVDTCRHYEMEEMPSVGAPQSDGEYTSGIALLHLSGLCFSSQFYITEIVNLSSGHVHSVYCHCAQFHAAIGVAHCCSSCWCQSCVQ
jgi:hypothetical protein